MKVCQGISVWGYRMRVLKFGGSCLDTPDDYKRLVSIVKRYTDGVDTGQAEQVVVVVSAAKGITDTIGTSLERIVTEGDDSLVNQLVFTVRDRYYALIDGTLEGSYVDEAKLDAEEVLTRMERLLYGILLTEELTPRTKDMALSFGERISAKLAAVALEANGSKGQAVEADKAGLVTDGEFGNASADAEENRGEFKTNITSIIDEGSVPVVTGFFGADEKGHVTTFGRGGSDYSAALIAAILEAESLDIWKDVAGFMSVDPKIISDAKVLETLSYLEAAELAYFGAKVIHPRTVEPVRPYCIPIRIRNAFDPASKGSVIIEDCQLHSNVIKSVAYSTEVAVLKVHGAAVGFKKGVLNKLTGAMMDNGINIKSVITSQTCITFLLEQQDLERSKEAINGINTPVVERLEALSDIALVGIVGEGIVRTEGLAARAFTSVADKGVNVLMISAGASSAAYYFVVSGSDIEKVIEAVHTEFFVVTGADR